MAIEQYEIFGTGYTAAQDKNGNYYDNNLVIHNSNLVNPPFTVNLWINKKAAYTNLHSFINLYNSNGSDLSLYGIGVDLSPPQRFRMRVQQSSGTATNNSNSSVFPVIDTWYMVTAVFTASNNRDLYVNGANPSGSTIDRPTTAPNRIVIGGISSTNGIFLNTGKNPSYGVSLYGGCHTAEVAVWSAALNADEISSLYKGARTIQVRPQNLITYLPLIREFKQDLTGKSSSVGIDPDYDSADYALYEVPTVAIDPIVVDHGIRRYG